VGIPLERGHEGTEADDANRTAVIAGMEDFVVDESCSEELGQLLDRHRRIDLDGVVEPPDR
jgi:hypothetical protein